MSISRKRKPTLEPEQDVGAVDPSTVTLTPPGAACEHGAEGAPMTAVLLDAMDEAKEFMAVGRICNDVTVWWPEARDTVLDAHRAYARQLGESGTEPPVYLVGVPMSSQGREPQWQRPHSCCWVDDIAQGVYPPPVEPMQEREDGLGRGRVVLVDTADHEKDR